MDIKMNVPIVPEVRYIEGYTGEILTEFAALRLLNQINTKAVSVRGGVLLYAHIHYNCCNCTACKPSVKWPNVLKN